MREPVPDQFREAREKALRQLKGLDPAWMAARSGASYSYPEKALKLDYLGEECTVAYPGGAVRGAHGGALRGAAELIILHYLLGADGSPLRGRWISYRDLPGARYHEAAFVADVERPLSLGLAGRLAELRGWRERNARGVELPGDEAFAWEALPRVPLLVIFNEADEEFPASARMLFDASAPSYLPTEDLEELAGLAARKLLAQV